MRLSPATRACLVMAGILTATITRPLPAQSSYEQLQAFSAVLNFVRLNYVDSVGYSELVRAAIEGTLRSLDPHSHFVSRADFARRSALERGELAVPGIIVEDVDSAVVVLGVYERSPAARAGVQPGDRIVRIDDTTTAGQRANAVELRLAGDKGSKVRVSLERGPVLDPDTVTVTIKRDFPRDFSYTSWSMVDSVTGYVRLMEFGEESSRQLRDALRKLKGRHARQFILDLRENPGGIVDEAVDIASYFLPGGSVVFRTRGRKRETNEDYVTRRDGEFRQPLVVLIDEHSASASEALAGSLQDNDRALILGRRSFGKALMQMVFVVPPTNDNVWLTVGRVVTPSGRIIQRRYKGLLYEQYRSLAGQGGTAEDTMEVFHTTNGREVHGGGGIAPDVELPGPEPLPVWWTLASDSGFTEAVADSVGFTLGTDAAAQAAWTRDPARWRATLVPPFLDRVRSRLGVSAAISPAQEADLARALAIRAVEVRWGREAAEEFFIQSDPDVQAAVKVFPMIGEKLKGP
ncbi:MAG: S41 family peptidase [Gemmatimonadales bacterium]